MKERAFVASPKHQYHVSQCGERDSTAHNEKNEDHYEYSSLFYFTDKH